MMGAFGRSFFCGFRVQIKAEDGPVGRLAEICSYIGVSFFEITRMAAENHEQVFCLSEEQEEYFCQHPCDYAFFDELMKRKLPMQIRDDYKLTKKNVAAILRRLETHALIERQTGDRVKLMVEGTHNWLHGGPMQRYFFYEENITFLSTTIRQLGPNLPSDHFITGADRRVLPTTLTDFIKELRETFVRFRKKAQTEESLLPAESLVSVKWLACLAPYQLPFRRYLIESSED